MKAGFWLDTWAVIRKEWLEWASSPGFLVNPLVVVGVFGIAVPLVAGQLWAGNLLIQWVWIWLPLFMSTGPVIDSFAGERERDTLEVLLSTRLSGRSILLGKVTAVAIYSWLVVLLAWVAGLLTIRLVFGPTDTASLAATVAPVWLSLLAAWLVALAGTIISLRAQSVRQAQQLTSVLLLGVFLVVALVGAELARQGAAAAAASSLLWVGLVMAAVNLVLAAWLLFKAPRSQWLIH